MSTKRRVALLEVNVLVALFDPDHVHHDVAHDWFAGHRRLGWATCPLTENGFLRTAGRVARSRGDVSVSALVDALRTFTSSGGHEFWPDDVRLLDDALFDVERIIGHQQLTDIYLLGLAIRHGGVLATFDPKIAIESVAGARPDDVAVLAPVD